MKQTESEEYWRRFSEFRRLLHRFPEVSGEERETSRKVVEFLRSFQPTTIETGMGGCGVAAIYCSGHPGPTILIRCELDALPIKEISDLPYKSMTEGIGHLCGHDGHMAMVAAVAGALETRPIGQGRAVLLFQPAEETGEGAKLVCDALKTRNLTPDFSYSLHNMPGLPTGSVAIKDGVFNCASIGCELTFQGKTAHASTPEQGNSPVSAIANLVQEIERKNREFLDCDNYQNMTIVHFNAGEPAFGIAPGSGKLMVTLRSELDEKLGEMKSWLLRCAKGKATDQGLAINVETFDHFPASVNHPDAVKNLREVFEKNGESWSEMEEPMRASEDFGRYAQFGPSAMFLLGSGQHQPGLHNPDYDFPDEILPVGARVFEQVLRKHLGYSGS